MVLAGVSPPPPPRIASSAGATAGPPKIVDKIRAVRAAGGTVVSFEFFPAKTEAGCANLLARVGSMAAALRPTFVTLTWRAAFKDEGLWLRIASAIQNDLGVDVLVHVTCHLPAEDIRRILRGARGAGIRNVLALRGDPPMGGERWQPVEGGLSHAYELVRLIRAEHGDWFCIGVAAYPECHIECWNSPVLPPSEQAVRTDLRRLKHKVDAGADFVLTQFVYDLERLKRFLTAAADAGIAVPILPGYMVLQNYSSFKRFTAWCRTHVPPNVVAELEVLKDNDEAVKSYGVQLGITACRAIAALTGSVHFYTMNLSLSVSAILEAMGLAKRGERVRGTAGARVGTGAPAARDACMHLCVCVALCVCVRARAGAARGRVVGLGCVCAYACARMHARLC